MHAETPCADDIKKHFHQRLSGKHKVTGWLRGCSRQHTEVFATSTSPRNVLFKAKQIAGTCAHSVANFRHARLRTLSFGSSQQRRFGARSWDEPENSEHTNSTRICELTSDEHPIHVATDQVSAARTNPSLQYTCRPHHAWCSTFVTQQVRL